MILIYSKLPLNKEEIGSQINLLKDRLSMFFIDDTDFTYNNEANSKITKRSYSKSQYIFILYPLHQRDGILSNISINKSLDFS